MIVTTGALGVNFSGEISTAGQNSLLINFLLHFEFNSALEAWPYQDH